MPQNPNPFVSTQIIPSWLSTYTPKRLILFSFPIESLAEVSPYPAVLGSGGWPFCPNAPHSSSRVNLSLLSEEPGLVSLYLPS